MFNICTGMKLLGMATRETQEETRHNSILIG